MFRRGTSLRSDLIWALAVLAGFVIGMVIFGADASILVGALIGVSLVVLVRAVRRRLA